MGEVMARGRMVNKKISLDKKVSNLCNKAGVDAGLVFTWLIPHLDVEGRFHGESDLIKCLVFPRVNDITVECIERALRSAAELGLIRWYTDGDGQYLEMSGFAKNQAGLRRDREAESEFPSPIDLADVETAGVDPELVRSNSGVGPAEHRRAKEAEAESEFPSQINLVDVVSETAGVDPELLRSNSGVGPAEVKVKVKVKDQVEAKVQVEDQIEVQDKKHHCGAKAPPRVVPPDRSKEILEVFAAYRVHHPRAHRKPNSKLKEWRAIKARLEEGYSVEDLTLAIEGCHVSPFHCGENSRGRKYQSLELVVRDGSKVNQFLEAYHARGSPVMTEKERRGVRAGKAWLARRQGVRHAEQ